MSSKLGPAKSKPIQRMIRKFKRYISAILFNILNIKRIHIIGCSRSGTTLLHLSMICFDNTKLLPDESHINFPQLSGRLKIAWHFKSAIGRKFFVTKRDYGWFKEENMRLLIESTIKERIGLIYIVRDPRDVMASIHGRDALQAAQQGEDTVSEYVTPEHWLQSVAAGEKIMKLLADYPNILTLRYEDIMLDPSRVEALISTTFGPKRRKNAHSIDRVIDNVDALSLEVSSNYAFALHNVRNFDRRSIGKWKTTGFDTTALRANDEIWSMFRAFCDRYDYAHPDDDGIGDYRSD